MTPTINETQDHHMTRTSNPRHLRTLPLATAVLLLLLLLPASAEAATYAVDGCQRPDGTRTFTDGWSPSQYGSGSTVNSCSAAGALSASWASDVPHAVGDYARWAFSAPDGTIIRSFSGRRISRTNPRTDSATPITFIKADDAFYEECGTSFPCSAQDGEFAFAVESAREVSFGVSCVHFSAGTCPAGETSIAASRLRVALEDLSSPRFDAEPTGSLTSPSNTERVRSVAYSASDVGGGLYRQRLLSDGVEVASAAIDENGGRCVRYPVEGGFTSPVPCKTSATSGMSLDTASLVDGEHEITLQVLDATNENKAAASWKIVVDNVVPVIGGVVVDGVAVEGQVLRCGATVAGQGTRLSYQWLRANPDGSGAVEIPGATSTSYLVGSQDVGRRLLCRVTATDGGGTSSSTSAFDSGSPASAVVASKDRAAGGLAGIAAPPLAPLPVCTTARVTLGNVVREQRRDYRRSGMTLVGRLTSTGDGRGLGGVTLDIMQTVTRAGSSRRTKVASTKTTVAGSFSVRVPAGPTRVLELSDPTCGTVGPQVVQRVRGAISARTTTPRVRNRQTARIRGRVLGGYVGKGLPLELQVKVGRKWRDVKAVTTNARGEFRVGYRFLRTFVRYTYRFRVVSRGGTAWPYLRASSAQIKVRVN